MYNLKFWFDVMSLFSEIIMFVCIITNTINNCVKAYYESIADINEGYDNKKALKEIILLIIKSIIPIYNIILFSKIVCNIIDNVNKINVIEEANK